ncbi:hypothetical protein SLEP1_g7911 [Rubroshorea leprosula]|uniref:Uncharacterized protein n=1 Tax=Rubroshorea leprosula TaxID=152421 RepID=A0AAV5I017_9ROSI|nr:hypothetical protein SLEP1_g7911 [Rubroshorea leprosula]
MISTVAKVETTIKPMKMVQYQSPISTHEPELGVLHCNGSVAGWMGFKGKLCSAPDACHLFGEILQRGFGSPEFIPEQSVVPVFGVAELVNIRLVTMRQKRKMDEYQESLALLFPNPSISDEQPLIFDGLRGYFGMVVPQILFNENTLAKLPESSNQLMNLSITLQEEICFGLRSSTAIGVGFVSTHCDGYPLDQAHGNMTNGCDRYSTFCSSNLRPIVKDWLEGCRRAIEAPFPKNLRCLTSMHVNGLKIFFGFVNMVGNFISEGIFPTLCYLYNHPFIAIGYLLLDVKFLLRNCSIIYNLRRLMEAEHVKIDGLLDHLSYLLKCPTPNTFNSYFGGLNGLNVATYSKGDAMKVPFTEAEFGKPPKLGNFMGCSIMCESFFWWLDGKPFHTYVVFLPWMYDIVLRISWFKNADNIFYSFKILSKGTSLERQEFMLENCPVLILQVLCSKVVTPFFTGSIGIVCCCEVQLVHFALWQNFRDTFGPIQSSNEKKLHLHTLLLAMIIVVRSFISLPMLVSTLHRKMVDGGWEAFIQQLVQWFNSPLRLQHGCSNVLLRGVCMLHRFRWWVEGKPYTLVQFAFLRDTLRITCSLGHGDGKEEDNTTAKHWFKVSVESCCWKVFHP